jgi:hypothetical protein
MNLAQIREALHKKADVNGDGRVSREDFDQVVDQAQASAVHAAQTTPMKALLVAAACGAVLGGAIVAAVLV